MHFWLPLNDSENYDFGGLFEPPISKKLTIKILDIRTFKSSERQDQDLMICLLLETS